MVSRCVTILMMLCSLQIPFVLEQPASSLMQHHPDFERLCRQFTIYRVTRLLMG